MTEADIAFERTLRRHGQSLTGPRRAVFAALRRADTLTMQELIAACAGRIDRASAYRTVALFEQLGIVQRLQIGWRYKLELTDNFHDHHHHATCNRCGAIIPLTEDAALERELARLAARLDFEHTSHQFEIRGLCSRCRTRER